MSLGGSPGGIEVVLVPWDDEDAERLRAEQQDELDRRYADLHEDDEPVEKGEQGAEDEQGVEGEQGVDDIDPATVLATFLVRDGGLPVGGAVLRRSPDHDDRTGSIKRMFIVPPERGRGLSRLLLGELERVAREHGLRRLVLETGSRQPESIGLYRSAGYTDTEPFGPWAGGSELICLAKDL